MGPKALVLGAAGQVGTAVVPALLADGWQVAAAGRGERHWPDDVRPVRVDRGDDRSFAAALGDGYDLLVDCVAFTAAHARQIVDAADRIGSAVVLSSVSVYADDRGRTLDESTGVDTFPELPVGVTEEHPTVPAGPETYSTRKVAMERVLLAAADRLPVTVLRPGAICGINSSSPRELWFVLRALDHRPVQILSHGGVSRFHTSTAANVAELVRLAAARPGTRLLNAVDPEALPVSGIGAAVNALLDHRPREVLIPGAADGVGDSPWSVPRPFVMSMARADRELGYRPVTGYAEALPPLVDWLVGRVRGRDWREAFPLMPKYYGEALVDYAAEDAWLAAQG